MRRASRRCFARLRGRVLRRRAALRPGERLDDLMIRGLKIIQPRRGFRFSLDAVLLAHFATLKRNAAAADLGTGTGVIALLLAARGAGRVTGVELNGLMAAMAARSVALNRLTGRIAVHRGDLRRIRELLPRAAGQMDLAVANPPYQPLGRGEMSRDEQVFTARHETTVTLEQVAAAAAYLVKYRGRFAMAHVPERLTDALAALRTAGLEPKRLRFVCPYAGRKPRLILVEGVRGGRPGLDVLPPLAVYQSEGVLAEEVREYYRQVKV